jgi:response regulator RpfG family c-di-GMP phosphodiesterase
VFSNASKFANKALGVRPQVGPIKSLQPKVSDAVCRMGMAAELMWQPLGASERRAQMTEDKKREKLERKAEEEAEKRKLKIKEAAEAARRMKEVQERRAAAVEAKRLADDAKRVAEEGRRAAEEKAKREAMVSDASCMVHVVAFVVDTGHNVDDH